jgi:hypothetical protein
LTAFLLLDDDAQSYTNAEVYYLRRLCMALPAGVVVRCTHDVAADAKLDGSPLVIAMDLRIAEHLTVRPDFTKDVDPEQTVLVRRSVRKLAEDARRKLQQFFGAVRPAGDHDCESCGKPMRPYYQHSKQNSGRPSKPDVEFSRMVAQTLGERGSPHAAPHLVSATPLLADGRRGGPIAARHGVAPEF